jgi:Flp pilus assembly protein TadG
VPQQGPVASLFYACSRPGGRRQKEMGGGQGAATLELALALPVFLFLALGVV